MSEAGKWLKEERRKTLGDWVAVCLACGFAQRYFEEWETELPASCPQCSGEIRSRCPGCGARFDSAFSVECASCGGPLRPRELFGTPIRKR
jgi:rRNA maturation endonuclease Nob1